MTTENRRSLTERGLITCLLKRNPNAMTVTKVSNGFIGRGYVLGASADEALDLLEEFGFLGESVEQIDDGFGVVFY